MIEVSSGSCWPRAAKRAARRCSRAAISSCFCIEYQMMEVRSGSCWPREAKSAAISSCFCFEYQMMEVSSGSCWPREAKRAARRCSRAAISSCFLLFEPIDTLTLLPSRSRMVIHAMKLFS